MGQVINVTTTDGETKPLDLDAASQFRLLIGGVWYEIDPPHIANMLSAYLTETYKGRALQDRQAHQRWQNERTRKIFER